MATTRTLALLALLCCFAGARAQGEPAFGARANPSGTSPIGLGPQAMSKFVSGAGSLQALSSAVGGVHFSRYADPVWDRMFAGRAAYWMGLAEGGCGWGNLLNQAKYPHLMAISLSAPTRAAIGINTGVGCGACVRMSCNAGEPYCKGGSVVGVITDVCPDTGGHASGNVCRPLQVDMYIEAHKIIAADSNPDVRIERVMCPTPDANIHMGVMQNGGSQLFLKINFQNVGGRGVLRAVTANCGGQTATLANQYGAVWVINNQPRHGGSCSFTLVDDGGNVLQTREVTMPTGGTGETFTVVDMGVQFGGGGGLGGGKAPPPKTPTPPKTPAPPTPPKASNVAPNDQTFCGREASQGKCGAAYMTRANNPRCPPEGCCAASCAGSLANGRKLM